MPKLGPKRILRNVEVFSLGDGSLSITSRFFDKEKSRWKCNRFWSCREQFQKQFNRKCENIIYCHRPEKQENMANFIWAIEKKLNIAQHSKIGPTNRNNISWIRISPFWLRSSMRRSFFTALLRASEHYDGEHIEKALFSVLYFNRTKIAVQRFLEGYTSYTGKVTGWHRAFAGKTENLIKTLLVKPRIKDDLLQVS